MSGDIVSKSGEIALQVAGYGGVAAAGTVTTVSLTPVLIGVGLIAGAVVACSYLSNKRKVDVAKLKTETGKEDFYILSKAGLICAAELNSEAQITATRRAVSSWESFEMLKTSDGRYAFKARNGKFISADQNRDGLLIANRDTLADWELFEIHHHDDYISMKASNGRFVSRREDNHSVLFACAQEPKEWEMFRIMKIA